MNFKFAEKTEYISCPIEESRRINYVAIQRKDALSGGNAEAITRKNCCCERK